MGIRLTILIAVVPAIAMLMFIYHRDKREKEPVKFLVLLCVLGAASTIPAAIVELIGEKVIHNLGLPYATELFVECIFLIGMAEELGKFLISTCVTWKNKSFNHSYDAIVYTVCVSLGFAILENILYVFTGGISTGILRAFTAVPLHCGVGVIMGTFYGKARECAYKDDRGAVIGYMVLAYIIPVIVHGAYDYSAFKTSYNISGSAMFFIILILIYVVAVWLIIYCSNHDHRIDGLPESADIGYYRKEYRRYRQGYGYGYGNTNNAGNYNPYGSNNPYVNNMNNGSNNPYANNMNNGSNNPYVNNMNNGSNNPYANNMNNGNNNPYANNMNNGYNSPYINNMNSNYNPYGNNTNNSYGTGYNAGSNNTYRNNNYNNTYGGNNYNGGVNDNYNSNYNYMNSANPGNMNNLNSYGNVSHNNPYNNNYNNSYVNNNINNNNTNNSNYNQQGNNNNYNSYNQQTNTDNYSSYNQQATDNNYNGNYNLYNNGYQNTSNQGNAE
jgi:RsiW-degrading membrane proteinase PrsW (M82 family)